uniref:Chemokine interleukin-8-like domain-containing protein n=1 Tax=Panthera leo TaxID=9689 RepID=A0A8C8WCN3_PANLE
MNLWLLLCLVVAASFVGIWCPTVHAQGVSEDCCLAYHRLESLDFLKRALGYQRQEVSGSCNLPAVIFFLRKHRMVCGNPRDKRVKYWTEFLDARKAKHHRTGSWLCPVAPATSCSSGSWKERADLASGPLPAPGTRVSRKQRVFWWIIWICHPPQPLATHPGPRLPVSLWVLAKLQTVPGRSSQTMLFYDF